MYLDPSSLNYQWASPSLVFISFLDAHQGAGHADHTSGNGAKFAQDPLSFSSGPITRLRAKRFKEALNGLVQEN